MTITVGALDAILALRDEVAAHPPTQDASTSPEPQETRRDGSSRRCERDGAPLAPRQKRFCSSACRAASWDEAHPRLNRPTHLPESTVIERLVAVMADRSWRTVEELRAMVGGAATALSARLREMRRVHGYHVEQRPRNPGSRARAHEYRLLLVDRGPD